MIDVMNMEIEFRGFDGTQWHYGDLEYNRKTDVARIHTYKEDGSYDKQYAVDPDTVGQFLGLCDINGVKIFVGDVVRIYESYEEYSDNQVKFAHGVFGVDNWTGKFLTSLSFFMCGGDSEYSVEVIGNVFENNIKR